MNCPLCQHENPPAAKFCAECAARLRAVCPRCGTEVSPTARYCHECAAPVSAPSQSAPPAHLPSLEEQFLTLEQAMPASFREQVMTSSDGENRIVTVLFADMSRSVETTNQLHPEDAAALISDLLKAMVDVLLKYGGRVDRFLGDGVLAVFGVPHAHEDDPERAIRAAMEIREAAQRLKIEVTAGINTGEVYVGGVGSDRHREVTVMGPVVNLASRLQDRAEPGQILVGEASYRLTRRAFQFSALALTLKGLPQPVTAYAVERALPHPEKVRGIEGLWSALIGRDEELARLKGVLDELLRGRGQIVTLIGEAGVGKSRLVAELRQGVQAFGRSGVQAYGSDNDKPVSETTRPERLNPLWLEGRCLELATTASYWLFIDLLRGYFGAIDQGEDGRCAGPSEAEGMEEVWGSRGERLIACLQRFVTQGDLSEDRYAEMGPLLGHLLSISFGTDWDERLKQASPEQLKHQTLMAVRDFFLALSRQQPIVLVLEDLHWADSLSLDLIPVLMETLTFAPILLLCVYRPERENKCWHLGSMGTRKCGERHTEITLRELTPPQSRRLIDALLSIDNLPNSVKEAILKKSGGNPFFVEEVIRSLIDAGMVYQEADVWRAREGIESVTVPESIQSVILSRVDRLEAELKHVLQSAAVIGRLFQRRLLGHVTRKEAELERALWSLEDLALIYQEQVIPEEEYSFKHVLTQETVYQNILRRRRTTYHQKVAEAMESLYGGSLEPYYEQLAYHYERSGVDEKAVDYLLKAGEKARRAYLNDAAVGYFQRALERLARHRAEAQSKPSAPGDRSWAHQRHEALRGLGQIHHRLGDEAQAEAEFREAVAIGKAIGLAPRELVRLHWWWADVLFWQNRFPEMLAAAEDGLALLGADTRCPEAALMNETLASAYGQTGAHQNRQKAMEFVRRNAQLLEHLTYSEELRSAYAQVAGTVASQEERLRWLRALEDRAEQYHDLRALAQVHQGIADVLRGQGDLRGAILRHDQALELFSRIGDVKLVSAHLLYLGADFLSLGELRRADEYVGRALQTVEVQAGQTAGIAYRTTVPLFLSLGCWEKATDACLTTIQRHWHLGLTGMWPSLMLGWVYLAVGKHAEARRQFREAMALLQTDSPLAHLLLAQSLSGLEAAEDPAEFRAFCRVFREKHPGLSHCSLVQWFLETAQPDRSFQVLDPGLPSSLDQIQNPGSKIQNGAWVWHDPFADCSLAVHDGLEIRAANERDLWSENLSAPRLLRSAAGDFALEAACAPAEAEKPGIGGLLLWKDRANFLRLERGTRGKQEISCEGYLDNKGVFIGRGQLAAERVFLRLERRKGRVKALCSADGKEWFTVGSTDFPGEDPVEVGLHAIGHIERAMQPGAYPEGTAIRFEGIQWSG